MSLAVRAGLRLFFASAPFLFGVAAHAGSQAGGQTAELPRRYVDTEYIPPAGRTIAVRAGGDFQAALNAARPGDVIVLEAGATFIGPFTLPAKTGSAWIIVRSSAPEGRPLGSDVPPRSLPPPRHRVDPAYAPLMPKLVAASGAVISAAPRAHHYRFIGIEIRPGQAAAGRLRSVWRTVMGRDAAAEDGFSRQTLVLLGAAETAEDQLPHHIIFDRCYLHGDPKRGARRGIALNSRYTAVIDSYLSDFKEVGADSQAVAGWNGSGPFKIVNNYLEGAGENAMFGGADPAIANLVPADIEIRGNHFAKPLSWKLGDPAYAGTPWTVKNLFELKNARRVLIDGNLFEYNWPHAQNGFAILFTVRNQDGAAPWSVVEDVTFSNNVVRHIGSGINILGRDDNHPSRPTRRILIKNNLFYHVGGAWGRGQLLQLLDGTADVTIEHNTALQTDSIVLGGDGRAHNGFAFSNNIAPHNAYGIIGSGAGVGRPTLERYFPEAIIRKNIIVGGPSDRYPAGNFFPASLDDLGFINRAGGDYRLGASSQYKRAATDRADVGVDFEVLCTAMLTAARPAPAALPCAPPGT